MSRYRGELVLGIESGWVNLYGRPNGQVQSIIPTAPGFDISGNSVYDLYDVSYGLNGSNPVLPADDHVLQWSASRNTFFNAPLDYSQVTNTPTASKLHKYRDYFNKSGVSVTQTG